MEMSSSATSSGCSLVNHDGIVYQKDLGPNTAAAAGTMKRFNPDSTWQRL
jgi:hypothetical protein